MITDARRSRVLPDIFGPSVWILSQKNCAKSRAVPYFEGCFRPLLKWTLGCKVCKNLEICNHHKLQVSWNENTVPYKMCIKLSQGFQNSKLNPLLPHNISQQQNNLSVCRPAHAIWPKLHAVSRRHNSGLVWTKHHVGSARNETAKVIPRSSLCWCQSCSWQSLQHPPELLVPAWYHVKTWVGKSSNTVDDV